MYSHELREQVVSPGWAQGDCVSQDMLPDGPDFFTFDPRVCWMRMSWGPCCWLKKRKLVAVEVNSPAYLRSWLEGVALLVFCSPVTAEGAPLLSQCGVYMFCSHVVKTSPHTKEEEFIVLKSLHLYPVWTIQQGME